jgi:Fe-S oxidoreductase/nitrate reductase gamma subunit
MDDYCDIIGNYTQSRGKVSMMNGPVDITLHGLEKIAFFAVLAIALIIFANEVYFYVRLLLQFGSEKRTDNIRKRIKNLFKYVFGQRRLLDQIMMGSAHFLIFWGFVIISFGTLNFIGKGISADFTLPLLSTALHAPFLFMLDLFSILVLVGIAIAVIRRFLPNSARMPRGWEAAIILILIGGLMLFDLLGDGFNMAYHAKFENASFVGAALGRAFYGLGFQAGTLATFSHIFWWSHLIFFLAILNYVPVSKHMHVFTSAFNVFFAHTSPNGKLSTPKLEDAEEFGVTKVEQYPWKTMLDSYSCTECGRCSDQCPATNTSKMLSPRKIVMQVRAHAEKKAPHLFKKTTDQFTERLIEDVITEEVIWDCTTCYACMRACPLLIEHIPILVDLRRALVLNEGRISSEGALALKNIEKAGDPWGLGQKARSEWYQGLDVKHISEKPDAEYLFWVGCAGALDARNIKVTQATARLMNKAGVSFAILGEDEVCTGDPARRLGEEYLYQTQAQAVTEMLNGAGVKKIFTNCPHCFNTLKNEYPDFGGNYEVYHSHQLLAQFISDGRLKVSGDPLGEITFHDSCYMGRHNHIYEPARQIIDSLPGAKRVEMKRSRDWSFCCGAGGGRMFLEEHGEHINVNRSKEAIGTGAKTIGLACPFCMTMITDGVKALDRIDDVKVKEVTEILDEHAT